MLNCTFQLFKQRYSSQNASGRGFCCLHCHVGICFPSCHTGGVCAPRAPPPLPPVSHSPRAASRIPVLPAQLHCSPLGEFPVQFPDGNGIPPRARPGIFQLLRVLSMTRINGIYRLFEVPFSNVQLQVLALLRTETPECSANFTLDYFHFFIFL